MQVSRSWPRGWHVSGSKCRDEALALFKVILSPLQFGGCKIRSGLSVIADAPLGWENGGQGSCWYLGPANEEPLNPQIVETSLAA